MRKRTLGWTVLIVANVIFCCVLSFFQATSVAQTPVQQPFANSTEQRSEMIEELRELNVQLREQNELLRSGQLRVVVEEDS